MANITKDQVIDWLSPQSVLKIARLVKDLEEKMGHQRECSSGAGGECSGRS
jgi:ribosomal protein L7/L12